MSGLDLENLQRGALLKKIGVTSLAAVSGVLAADGEADAVSPFNLTITSSSSNSSNSPGAKITLGAKAPATAVPPKQSATDIVYMQVAVHYKSLIIPNGLTGTASLFRILAPTASGIDENEAPALGPVYDSLGDPDGALWILMVAK